MERRGTSVTTEEIEGVRPPDGSGDRVYFDNDGPDPKSVDVLLRPAAARVPSRRVRLTG